MWDRFLSILIYITVCIGSVAGIPGAFEWVPSCECDSKSYPLSMFDLQLCVQSMWSGLVLLLHQYLKRLVLLSVRVTVERLYVL